MHFFFAHKYFRLHIVGRIMLLQKKSSGFTITEQQVSTHYATKADAVADSYFQLASNLREVR